MGATCCLPAAAGLGQVFISSVVWFGLELALMQQGQQLGDLLQDRKNLLTPHNSDPARFLAGCFPQCWCFLFIVFPLALDASAIRWGMGEWTCVTETGTWGRVLPGFVMSLQALGS